MIAKKVLTKISAKYSDFADVFSSDLAFKLPKYNEINNYTIKLVDGQYLSYRPIYSLELVELEILKAYIEINLANKFIRLSKSPANALIFFNRKSDGCLQLWVNYKDLNNLTFKNRYPLMLIGKLLDKLKRAKRFTHLDFISLYH